MEKDQQMITELSALTIEPWLPFGKMNVILANVSL